MVLSVHSDLGTANVDSAEIRNLTILDEIALQDLETLQKRHRKPRDRDESCLAYQNVLTMDDFFLDLEMILVRCLLENFLFLGSTRSILMKALSLEIHQ